MAILSGAGAVLAVETQASGTIDVDALADLGAAVIILDKLAFSLPSPHNWNLLNKLLLRCN